MNPFPPDEKYEPSIATGGAAPRPDAPMDAEPDHAEAIRRGDWLTKHGAPTSWVILTVQELAVIKHEVARLREERDELNRRLEEQHKLYCEETKRHNETWAKIHAAMKYLDKEFVRLPPDLIEAVREVVFRVTLVELGRNSLQGEVAELRDKRKQLIEKLRESVNDTRELNDLAEALVTERDSLRAQLATLRQELEEKCAENDRAWSAHLQAYGAAMKECAAWQAKFTDLNKSLMAELRDPSGTIWEHAEALQKERDELRAKLDDNSAAGIHSCSDNCQRIECVQRREIAELRAKLAKLSA